MMAKAMYQGSRDISVNQINSFSGVAAGGSPTSIPVTLQLNDPDKFVQLRTSTGALEDAYQDFNFNPYNLLQTPFKRFNVYAAAHYAISDRLEVYSRALFSKNTVKSIIAPSGVFGEELSIPLNNPYLPGPTRLQLCADNGIAVAACTATSTASVTVPEVYRRTPEIGSRTSTYSTQVFDYKFGLRFDISDRAKLDVSGAYGESENFEARTGYVRKSRLQQALNANNTTSCTDKANGCVPLNLFGDVGSITPAQAGFLEGSSSVLIKTALVQTKAVLTGDFGTLSPFAEEAAGFAVGGEYRKYTGDRQPDSLAQNPGELGGAGGATLRQTGGYSVKEAFGEIIAPLVQNAPFAHSLTLEAGIRYSQYNINAAGNPSFGTTTWKAASSWEPVEKLKIRANYQRAVRAPNIEEFFDPVSTALDNLSADPCATSGPTGPAGNILLRNICVAQGAPIASATAGTIQQPAAGQVNVTGGGNPNAKPEKASTYTVGFVVQPGLLIENLSLSLDYYNITINNAINSATPGDIIGDCFNNITAASATSVACTSIRRSTGGRLSGSTATVTGLPQPLTNLGRRKTDGIDLTVNYKYEIGNVGLDLAFSGNWTKSSRFQASPTSLDRECVGYYSVNCASIQPEFTWNQRTSINFGIFETSLLWRHLSAVEYEPAALVTATGAIKTPFNGVITGTSPLAGTTANFNKIGAYDYFDLSLRANVSEQVTLNFAVDNLFNKKPPVVGSTVGTTGFNSGNTYPSTYDALGRSFTVSAKLRF
jgi:iron complex outermembrane recepter protein